MVRGSLFASGLLNVVVGIFVILASFGERTNAGFQSLLSIGMGMALAGLLLLGFARVILLLEQIVANTSRAAAVTSGAEPAEASRPAVSIAASSGGEPMAGNHTVASAIRDDIYAGRRFSVHRDGKVLSRLGEGQGTWLSEAEFKAWSDRQLSP